MTNLNSVEFLDYVLGRAPSVAAVVLPLRNELVERYGAYAEPVGQLYAPSRMAASDKSFITSSDLADASASARLRYAYDQYVVTDEEYLGGVSIYDRICADMPYCLYCDFGEASQLDHFLPRNDAGWPEYSIHFDNLVPSCGRCNTLKNRHTLLTFHPQGLHVLDQKYIVLRVDIENQSLSLRFELSFPYGFPPALVGPLTEQFRILRLSDRFAIRARDFVGSQREALLKQHNIGGSMQVCEYLTNLRFFASQRYKPNHWERITLDALVDCEKFHTLDHWIGLPLGLSPEFVESQGQQA